MVTVDTTRRRVSDLAAPVVLAAVGVGACAVLLATDPTVPGGVIPTCPSKSALGIICPGCGSCRMIYSLLHGDIAAAVRYNALGMVALPTVLWSYLVWTMAQLRWVELPRWERFHYSPHVVGALTGIWLIVRNIPVEPFVALRV